MNVLAPSVLILLAMLAGFGLLIFALIDLVRRPADDWERIGHNQIVWALIVVFVWVLGPVLYLFIARPAFMAAPINGAVVADGR